MGMFDDVRIDPPVPCPGCGKPLVSFQTKDREWPELAKLTVSDLVTEKIDNFYTNCHGCQGWVEFTRVMERTEGLSQFDVTFSPRLSDGSAPKGGA